MERAAGATLPRPAEDVVIEIVPGNLPGTVHITRNGVVVDEFEVAPEQVDSMIDLLRRLLTDRRPEG